jgi:hypothetical protein
MCRKGVSKCMRRSVLDYPRFSHGLFYSSLQNRLMTAMAPVVHCTLMISGCMLVAVSRALLSSGRRTKITVSTGFPG